MLFAVGLLVGPGPQILQPVQTFGIAMRRLVGLAVAIVVFAGGLVPNSRRLRSTGESVLRLMALALPISFVQASAAAHLVVGMR